MFWDRQSRSERVQVLHEIQETMRRHHRMAQGREAHPQDGFLAPQTASSHEAMGTVGAGSAPVWEL